MLRTLRKAVFIVPLFSLFSAHAEMGPKCERGELAFYGKMKITHAEEKLCLLSPSEGVFYTQSEKGEKYFSHKTTDVTKVESEGSSGKAIGYRFTLDGTGKIGFKGFFKENKETLTMAYFSIDKDIIEITPESAVIN